MEVDCKHCIALVLKYLDLVKTKKKLEEIEFNDERFEKIKDRISDDEDDFDNDFEEDEDDDDKPQRNKKGKSSSNDDIISNL